MVQITPSPWPTWPWTISYRYTLHMWPIQYEYFGMILSTTNKLKMIEYYEVWLHVHGNCLVYICVVDGFVSRVLWYHSPQKRFARCKNSPLIKSSLGYSFTSLFMLFIWCISVINTWQQIESETFWYFWRSDHDWYKYHFCISD